MISIIIRVLLLKQIERDVILAVQDVNDVDPEFEIDAMKAQIPEVSCCINTYNR